jgi:VIT1/CCC1 family predicted Fe2+/Mn2+ transporter
MSAEEGLHGKRRKARILMPQQRNSLAINTDNRVVSVANRGRNAARIPDTPERQRLENKRSIREVVFGAQDGILTTLGIVTGFSSASPDRAAILLTGFLSLLVGAISMGVGEYLGGKSEREVVQNAIDFERQEMLDTPAEEFAEQVAYYRLKGFTDDEALMIVRRLEKNPDIWLHEMVRDEFGIDVREAESGGLRASFAMAGSFAIGAALPVIPYAFGISLANAIWAGLLLAVLALFGIGYFAGTLSARNPYFKGCEIVAFGMAVFAISWAAGHYVPALFGHGAISVGG